MTLKGIDISSYQPTTYSTSGLDFVFTKATEGTSYVNSRMTAQAARARSAGLVVGFYHFLHPGSIQQQAQYFVTQAASQAGDILACDWEPTSSGLATNAEKDAFIRAVQALRPDHRVILYCDVARWTGVDTTGFAGDGLWIADYVTPGKPRIKASWAFHQYTDAAPQGGDGDIANPSLFPNAAALRAWAAKSQPTPTPTPTPKPVPTPATPQWKKLLDHVLAVPEGVYEHWNATSGWDNHTPWGVEYGEDGVPYCVIGAWDMYHDCALDSAVPKTDNVNDFATWARAHGEWSQYPSVGAWMDLGDGAHAEVVIGFTATDVISKGWNSVQTGATDAGQGNGVWTHTLPRTDPRITGYLAPRFPDSVCPPTADPHDPRGGTAVASYIPQEEDMPAWNDGEITPGPQPTVRLVPHGSAWQSATNRKLHLGMDEITTTPPKATVRVAIHNGTAWRVSTVNLTAAAGTVDVPMTADDQKVSLQTTATGVAYAIESW
jgi:hypothetical protein